MAVDGQRGCLLSVPRHAIHQSWTHVMHTHAHTHTHTHTHTDAMYTHMHNRKARGSQTSRTVGGQTHTHRVAYSDAFASLCSFLLQPKSPQEPSFTRFYLLASMLEKACQGAQQHHAAWAFPSAAALSFHSSVCLLCLFLSPSSTLQLHCTKSMKIHYRTTLPSAFDSCLSRDTQPVHPGLDIISDT